MLLVPSAVMLASQVTLGIILAIAGPTHTWVAWLGVALFYTFSASFNMSWGPVGNLYPGTAPILFPQPTPMPKMPGALPSPDMEAQKAFMDCTFPGGIL